MLSFGSDSVEVLAAMWAVHVMGEYTVHAVDVLLKTAWL